MGGNLYYQRLKHLVSEKARSGGGSYKKIDTKETVLRRSKNVRFGEMEKDCLVCHGSYNNIRDRFCTSSEIAILMICSKCGTFLEYRNNYKVKYQKSQCSRCMEVGSLNLI